MKEKIKATKEQLRSYKRICKRYLQLPVNRFFAYYDNCLICDFGFIVIGIEKDGYVSKPGLVFHSQEKVFLCL